MGLENFFEKNYSYVIVAVIVSIFVIVSLAGQIYEAYAKKRPAISAAEWRPFKLISKTQLSPNTAAYKFELPKGTELGLPVGQHVQVGAQIGEKFVFRSYTPTEATDNDFTLVVKTYPNGNISKYLSELRIGDEVKFKGPKGQMRYVPGYADHIGMIAGGTGLTPMLQIIKAVLSNPKDTTRLSLIYANVNEEDILLRAELEALALAHPDQFKLYHVLNNPPEEWEHGQGFVSKDHISERLFTPHSRTRTLLCGPPPMINAMKGHLESLGHPKARTISKYEDEVFCF